MPQDLQRVKLLIEHEGKKAAVGYMTAYQNTPTGIDATFYLPPGARGDEVIADAKASLRDGLSVGIDITKYKWVNGGNVMHVEASTLHEVSVVTIPAYEDARITKVQANHNQKETHMTTPTTAVPEIDYTKLAASLAPQLDQIVPPRQNRNVLGLNASASLEAVAHSVADAYRGGASPLELSAALNDLLPADDEAEQFIKPQWIDEVWEASRIDRPFFDGGGR